MRFSIIVVTTAFLSLAHLGGANVAAGYGDAHDTDVTHHPFLHRRSYGHHTLNKRMGTRQLEERNIEDLYLYPRDPPGLGSKRKESDREEPLESEYGPSQTKKKT
ncbi:hypothetical protein AX17_007169 [Amanita inopinata Kibby_2008]|nr:hypothetical protein AX17_007169 [Amanita inopinata Kibby_2008]